MSLDEDEDRKLFEKHVRAWDVHCESNIFSSNINDSLDHDSYRDLVKMGQVIVPWVIVRYEKDVSPRWGFLLEDITHEGIIENRNSFSPADMQQQWLEWWKSRIGD